MDVPPDMTLTTDDDRTVKLSTSRALFLLLLICSVIFAIVQKHKNKHFNRLAATFPGPTPLPIIGNAMEFISCGPERLLSKLIKLGLTYRTPFKFYLGPKMCIPIAKPEDLQIVLNSSKVLAKDDSYRFFRNIVGNGLFAAPVEKWKKTRRAVAPAFNAKLLEEFVPVFNERNNILMGKLKPHCDEGVEFDLWRDMVSLGLDIICQTALGVKINAQDDLGCKYVRALARATTLDYLRIFKPWLYPDFIYDRVSYAKELKDMYETLHGLPKAVIQMRKKEFAENKKLATESDGIMPEKSKRLKVFIDILLELNDQGLANFSDKDLLDEVVTMMVGGSETSAVTNCFCLLLLAMFSAIQEKVFEEQFSIFQGENRPVTTDDLSKMVYTEQVIKETLRTYPPGPVFLRKVTENTAITGGHILPAGATVIIAPLITHMDPEVWPDPYKFNPENFSAANLENKHKYAFIPFSGGSRGCIGSRYAMMSMKTTISIFIRNYKLTTTTRRRDIKLGADLLLRSSNGWKVKLEPRINPKSALSKSS